MFVAKHRITRASKLNYYGKVNRGVSQQLLTFTILLHISEVYINYGNKVGFRTQRFGPYPSQTRLLIVEEVVRLNPNLK